MMQGASASGFITTRQAARLAGLTLHGLRLWYGRYPGLARKVAGRWHVDPAVLSNILSGTPLHNGRAGHGRDDNDGGRSGS